MRLLFIALTFVYCISNAFTEEGAPKSSQANVSLTVKPNGIVQEIVQFLFRGKQGQVVQSHDGKSYTTKPKTTKRRITTRPRKTTTKRRSTTRHRTTTKRRTTTRRRITSTRRTTTRRSTTRKPTTRRTTTRQPVTTSSSSSKPTTTTQSTTTSTAKPTTTSPKTTSTTTTATTTPTVTTNPSITTAFTIMSDVTTSTTITTTPADCDCGSENSIKRHLRLLSGTTTSSVRFPWLVKVVINNTALCGGSIISPYYVVTSTRCLISSELDVVTLEEVIKVVNYTVPPGAVPLRSYDNDIALLRLERPVTFGRTVRPLCLPFAYPNSSFVGESTFIFGWNETVGFTPSTNETLDFAPVTITQNTECANNAALQPIITGNMMCVSDPNRGFCDNDIGGPMTWIDPDYGKHTLVGIISFARDCQFEQFYTKVNNYLDWIRNITAGERFCTPSAV